jgi:hypothetical protein
MRSRPILSICVLMIVIASVVVAAAQPISWLGGDAPRADQERFAVKHLGSEADSQSDEAPLAVQGDPIAEDGASEPAADFATLLPAILKSASYQAALAHLSILPGFASAQPTSETTIAAFFSDAVPLAAPSSIGSWSIQYVPHQEPTIMSGFTTVDQNVIPIEEAVRRLQERQSASPDGPYLPLTSADGIGPGSGLTFPTGGGGFGLCTASYLFQDPTTQKFYLSTAGHCLFINSAGPATTGRESPTLTRSEVRICVEFCVENANAIGGEGGPFGDTAYVSFRANATWHPVAFAQAQGVGLDFGLIEIHPNAVPLLRPYLPVWGGPIAYEEPPAGDFAVTFGHGAYCCPLIGAAATRLPTDQARAGIVLAADSESFDIIGHSAGGDSGSAVGTGQWREDKMLFGENALGVLTHGSCIVACPVPFPTFLGTSFAGGLALASAKGYGGIALVNEDFELVPFTAPPTPLPEASITNPTAGSSVAQGTPVTVTGTASFPAMEPITTYYLHRDDCGGEADNPHMDLVASPEADGGSGCGNLLGPVGIAVEAAAPLSDLIFGPDIMAEEFPAIPTPTTPINLDVTQPASFVLYYTGDLGSPHAFLDIEGQLLLDGTTIASGRTTQTVSGPGSVEIDMPLTASTIPAGSSLTFRLIVHEAVGPMFVELGGDSPSRVELPLADTIPQTVEVSVDDPTFSTGALSVIGTETWTASWDTATVGLGVHTIFARATQAGQTGPAASTTLTIIEPENVPPVAAIDGPSSAKRGKDITFTSAGSSDADGSIVSYAWDFGNGMAAEGSSVTVRYKDVGTYTVTLTVTDSDGATDTAAHTITIGKDK